MYSNALMSKNESSTPGIAGAARMVMGSLAEALRYRGELFSIELNEEKRSIFGLLVLALLAVFALFTAFLCLNTLVLVLFWDHAVLVAGILALVYLAGAALATFVMLRRLRNAPPPFDSTMEVLRKDQELLSRKGG